MRVSSIVGQFPENTEATLKFADIQFESVHKKRYQAGYERVFPTHSE
jgi:hypothetical protein